ncbi:Mob1/phocein [Amniculicola lignicola CBS 123094]|uniref:Mob1/phocein n=1 Tax=Amniculicola lignicola CBS 123094 TaxID=1392246 RepID=A0A6A5WMP0_9PLEO|nr:Mob1/phocein [Amniculicola lignicola CBS 123094]
MAASPASSPRLPSPPPIAEDQLGPMSPIASEEQQKLFTNLDQGAARRIRPGTKAPDMAEGPPLVELAEIDSAFQLTEHLKALHNFLTHPIGANKVIPVDKDMARKLAQPPDNVDKTLWLYELCRFLTQKVNSIIIGLFSDNPPCSSLTCPEMRASEWQYLCAVHDPPKSCCAIDYCCHTLDWAANTLVSPKTFPSRLALGNDSSTQHQQIRQLTNIFRRVYRIFAHAWFQHRDMFWKVEGRTGLYVFFKTVCDFYGLIPSDNYTIPREAEGIEESVEGHAEHVIVAAPVIMKREASNPGPQESENSSVVEGVSDHTLSTAGTTRKHRSSPSVGATLVHTVVEEAEEEEPEAKDEPEIPIAHIETPDQVTEIEPENAPAPVPASEEPEIGEKPESKEEETATAVEPMADVETEVTTPAPSAPAEDVEEDKPATEAEEAKPEAEDEAPVEQETPAPAVKEEEAVEKEPAEPEKVDDVPTPAPEAEIVEEAEKGEDAKVVEPVDADASTEAKDDQDEAKAAETPAAEA